MTYCVGLRLDAGLVLLSDTRTNAGVDNIARFRKMFTWERPGERAVCLLCAGNLSITQGVVTLIETALEAALQGDEVETVLNAASLFRVAEIVGGHMAQMQARYGAALTAQGAQGDATLLLAGQRRGGQARLFMIYSPGNFIEATGDSPFFQIGEHKYGKPILDRVITPATSLGEAMKAALVSMDSTLRSNLSVGMPLDLAVIPAGACRFALRRRIAADDPDFAKLSADWSDSLRAAFRALPDPDPGGALSGT
jgi:putative proteasome-type protease